jgi:signal transduction histidine kinase
MKLKEADVIRIFEATRAMTSTLQLSELLEMVMKLVCEVVHAEVSSILLMDHATNELYFDVALGEKGGALHQIRLKNGEGIAGWVAQNAKAAIVNDVANDPRWTQKGDKASQFKTRAILAVPMLVRDRLIGVMEGINRVDGEAFTQDDAEVLEIFAAQAAVAIENARLFESIRQEKEKMSTILGEMAEGVLLLDPMGMIAVANPAAKRLLGMELKGQFWTEIESGFQVKPSWSEITSSLGGAGGIELTRRSAPPLILSGVVTQICDDRGKISGYLAVVTDVTEERREAQLKRNFLALVSHKLKTPLVAIRGFAPMLLEKPEELNKFQKTAIETIDRNSILLTSLVEKITWYSALESDTLELSKKPYSVASILDAALSDLAPVLKDTQSAVSSDDSVRSLPPVSVDKIWMKEVFRNIIENAIKFSAADAREVQISGRLDGKYVEISMADKGVGIPSEHLQKIFQKFYQVESAFTGQVQGMGLGLALVKRVIEAHGGTVDVTSTLGKGSTFILRLPAFAEASADKPAHTKP